MERDRVVALLDEDDHKGLATKLGFASNEELVKASEVAPGFEGEDVDYQCFICQTPDGGWAIWSIHYNCDSRIFETEGDARKFAQYIIVANDYNYECCNGDADEFEWADEWFSCFSSADDVEAWMEIGLGEAHLALEAAQMGYTPGDVERMAEKKLPTGHLFDQNYTSKNVLYNYCYRDGPPPGRMKNSLHSPSKNGREMINLPCSRVRGFGPGGKDDVK